MNKSRQGLYTLVYYRYVGFVACIGKVHTVQKTLQTLFVVVVILLYGVGTFTSASPEKAHECSEENPHCCQYVEPAEESHSCCAAPEPQEKSCPTSKSDACRCFMVNPFVAILGDDLIEIPVEKSTSKYDMFVEKCISQTSAPQSPPPQIG